MFARVIPLALALVLALAGPAGAEKARLAVLGLEVSGSINHESTSDGRLITDRFRARIALSPYFVQAPNSQKDLIDEKAIESCDETPACMAKIGGRLKVQYLMYGKIEKRPKDDKEGYQLAMKFLDVENKTVKEWGDWIALGDLSIASMLDSRVATAFDALSRDAAQPTSAPIMIGPAGPGRVDKPKGGFPWKTTAVVTSAVTLAALGSFAHFGLETYRLDKNCKTINKNETNLGSADVYEEGIAGYDPERCATGPSKGKYANISAITAAAFGGIALYAVYKGFIAKKESPSQVSAGRSTRKKKQFSVTPIISPDGGGATFRLDW